MSQDPLVIFFFILRETSSILLIEVEMHHTQNTRKNLQNRLPPLEVNQNFNFCAVT